MTSWAYLFAALALLNGTLGFAAVYRLAHARAAATRLRAQISEERIAALDEQSRMISVATAECGHDVAWKMLESALAPRRHELAQEILEDVSS